MRVLSQLVELFEKDSAFLKEWQKDATSAVSSREPLLGGPQQPWFQKLVHALKHKKHLLKRPFLFGM